MNREQKIFLICFAKTPNLSPFKTRLSGQLDEYQRLSLYTHLIESTEELFSKSSQEIGNLECFWAIEEEGMASPFWRKFPTINQGKGSLGERLFYVQEQMLKDNGIIIFIGIDCPLITSDIIKKTISELKSFDHVLGKAIDGGYYLYAAKNKVSLEKWMVPQYSTAEVFECFKQELKSVSINIPTLYDLDEYKDLLLFLKEKDLSAQQKKLQDFISHLTH